MKKQKIKKFLLDIISFNTPQAIVFNLSMAFILLAILPTELLYRSPINGVFMTTIIPWVFKGNCPTEGIFANCHAPSCGMTRGMSRLLHGDFAGALEFNRAIFILLFIMLAVLIVNVVKSIKEYKKTGKII